MSLRIAMISEHASPLAGLGGADSGGQNVYVAQVARHLARCGHRVDVLTRRDAANLPPVVEWLDGVRVLHVPAGPPERCPKEQLLPLMEEFTHHARRHARRSGYDLVHANFFMSALVGANLKKALGLPLIVTFHALGRVRRLHQGNADTFPEERLAIEDHVVAVADRIIAECPQDREDLLRLYHADRQRIRIIPCGFDPHEFGPADKTRMRAGLGLLASEFLILQLGRMVPRKGVDNVIRALARLRRDHELHARLLIVGGETHDPDPALTPEIGRLRDIAQSEGVADLVTFTGSRERSELRAYYTAADVFVTTPWYEPFGITPVEAMACGTPVIGSAVGGIKTTVRDGVTGYLVPPKDPDALADRLAHLMKQPALLREFSRQAIRRARALYTWERVGTAIESLYASVVEATTVREWTAQSLPNGRASDHGCKAVFLDKDGTLIEDIPYNVDPQKIRLVPQAGEALRALHENGYVLIVVSNQSGVARGLFPERALREVERSLRRQLAAFGVPLAGFYYCPHHPQGAVEEYAVACRCRKPAPGMLHCAAADLGINLAESWMVGDILDDIEAGRRAGCRTVLIDNGNETEWRKGRRRRPHHRAMGLAEAARLILAATPAAIGGSV
ncbi:MAG TPA: HAD-IIIA family hydrolase [Gemmataceae bacterium]|nr:HAD-IIIA family hydrolase [Gemmataceae bacterium]